MEQMLSRPPQATKLPLGEYAHVMTQEDRSGMAWTLFVVYASQMISFPSCEAETRCLRSVDQCIAYIFAKCPFSVRLVLIPSRGNCSVRLRANSPTRILKSARSFRQTTNVNLSQVMLMYSQVVSASSSFVLFIRSFNPSASRLAICIFC